MGVPCWQVGLGILGCSVFQRKQAREITTAVNSVIVYYFTQFVFDEGDERGKGEVCSSLYRHVSLCRSLSVDDLSINNGSMQEGRKLWK
jgi:hypothetical protein